MRLVQLLAGAVLALGLGFQSSTQAADADAPEQVAECEGRSPKGDRLGPRDRTRGENAPRDGRGVRKQERKGARHGEACGPRDGTGNRRGQALGARDGSGERRGQGHGVRDGSGQGRGQRRGGGARQGPQDGTGPNCNRS